MSNTILLFTEDECFELASPTDECTGGVVGPPVDQLRVTPEGDTRVTPEADNRKVS